MQVKCYTSRIESHERMLAVESYLAWGNQAVAWVQSFRTPALDILFQTVTLLGDARLFLLLVPFVLWCVNKRVGLGLAYLFTISAYGNDLLKAVFAAPRPHGPGVTPLVSSSGPSFPSGHAQSAGSVWTYLALHGTRKRALLWAGVLLLVLLAAFSRIYLGVHSPGDVVAGVLLGVGLAVAVAWAAHGPFREIAAFPLPARLLLASLPLLLALVGSEGRGYAAAIAGIGIGASLEGVLVKMATKGRWWHYGGRFLLGLPGLLVPFALLGSDGTVGAPLADAALGLFAGLWLTVGAPWAFVTVRLARPGSPSIAKRGGRLKAPAPSSMLGGLPTKRST